MHGSLVHAGSDSGDRSEQYQKDGSGEEKVITNEGTKPGEEKIKDQDVEESNNEKTLEGFVENVSCWEALMHEHHCTLLGSVHHGPLRQSDVSG